MSRRVAAAKSSCEKEEKQEKKQQFEGAKGAALGHTQGRHTSNATGGLSLLCKGRQPPQSLACGVRA